MKLEMTPQNRAILAAVLVAVAAVLFWMMALSPKREEASKLGTEVENLQASLSQHEGEVRAGEEAKKGFSDDYRQLVVLGKATPGDAETSSLLVQLSQIARESKVRFSNLELEGSGEQAEASASTGEETTPTEAAASLMPLGAEIGPAGLAVMPYSLTFTGTFFHLADFIHGLDRLVKTNKTSVSVDGRLLTINGFTLKADTNREFPMLEGEFSVTTFLTPPNEGLAAGGAAPEATGATTEAAPASTTIGGPAQ
jgi:Tfp pilus assembly protein PilO